MKSTLKAKMYPTNFYEELYEHRIRRVHSVIEILSWDEDVIDSIEGVVMDGSIGIDGNSTSRRNLTLRLTNLDREGKKISDLLSFNKKARVFIGLENKTRRFTEDSIIWFNMGSYILGEPSYSHSVDNITFSFSGFDKMSMMNGILGGRLTSPVSFTQLVDEEVVSMSWREIFYNSATLFGGENPGKVVVEGVPDFIREYSQVKDVGGLLNDFIHVRAPEDVEGDRIIVRAWSPDKPETEIAFKKGDRLYKLQRFGPPNPRASATENVEPYMKNTGEAITEIYSDIVDNLSNTHEFFYTVDGDLMLQPIKTFVNERFNPDKNPEYGYYSYELNMNYFQPNFAGLPFIYDLTDKKTITGYTNNPSWENIKNDFIVTGKNGQSLEVAIDDKPTSTSIKKWFITLAEDYNMESTELSFIRKDGVKRECYNARTNTVPYEFKPAFRGSKPIYIEIPLDKIPWQVGHGLVNYYARNIYGGANHRALPRWGKECESMIFKWNLSLDEKTLKPNTGIFNPSLIGLGTPWLAGYPVSKPAVSEGDVETYNMDDPLFTDKGDPAFWLYFLDLIDTNTSLGKYSIALIGRRPVAQSIKSATTLFRTNPRELVVVTEKEVALLGGDPILEELKTRGQSYAVIKNLSEQNYIPTSITEHKDRPPFSNIIGNPLKNEKMYYSLPRGDGTAMSVPVGGKFTGQLIENHDFVQEKAGYILVTPGTYTDPFSHSLHEDNENKVIKTPFAGEEDDTEVAFLAFISNKNGRIPDSGPHKFFAVIKRSGSDWFYGKGKEEVSWQKFEIDTEKDTIVASLEQNVHRSEDYISPSGEIDALNDWFNIRDSKMADIFSIDGAIDCFGALRSLMYKHTNISEVISIRMLPMYHLEPNTLISVSDEETEIEGIFMITSLTIPIGSDGGEMNISAIRVHPRI